VPEYEIKEFGLRIGSLVDVRNEKLNLIFHGDGVEASNGDDWGRSPQDPIAAQ